VTVGDLSVIRCFRPHVSKIAIPLQHFFHGGYGWASAHDSVREVPAILIYSAALLRKVETR
jgi:hypothetical protein